MEEVEQAIESRSKDENIQSAKIQFIKLSKELSTLSRQLLIRE
jgi:hypothetical protein